jgi:hypothetical protein
VRDDRFDRTCSIAHSSLDRLGVASPALCKLLRREGQARL